MFLISDTSEESSRAQLVHAEKDGSQIHATFSLPSPIKPNYEIGHGKAIHYTAGTVFNKFEPTGTTRFDSYTTPMYNVQGVPTSFHEQVKLARDYFHNEPITGTVIDILAQFSVGPIEHVTDDNDVKSFFDAIYETSNLREAIKWAFLEYYVACNVWPYRGEPGEEMTSRTGVAVPSYSWTVLNPEQIEIQGTLLFDMTSITIKPNAELIQMSKSTDRNTQELFRMLPTEVQRSARDGTNIVLSPDRVFHISRNKQPFERYAVPFIMRAHKPLMVKEKLIQMDLSTADGVINQLVTVTIGNDNHPANQAQLDTLGEILATPSKAYALLWNHTLNVKFHKPEANFFDAKKYEQVNRDIEMAYGIARSVISDEGTYASQSISVKSLIQWLEWGREDIRSWIEHEYRIIAEENGLPTHPKVRFRKVNLQEERAIKNVLMSMHEHGFLSRRTIIEETGHDFNMEVERLTQESELVEEGLFRPNSPHHQDNAPRPGPGRPDDSPDTEERDRDSEPEPIGSSLGSYQASAETEEEQERQDELFATLVGLYDDLSTRLKTSLVKTTDIEIQSDIITSSLLSFVNDANEFSRESMTKAFSTEYTGRLGQNYESSPNAKKWLDESIAWNAVFVAGLAEDIQANLMESLFDGGDIAGIVELALEVQAYRLPHFAKESLRKSKFYATTLAMSVSRGANRGRWNATFENSCPICAERHGNIYSLEELLQIYPEHPNCQCFIDYMS